ncbi:hypothetical protein Tco_1366634 [Tanacetum coccineum]
MPSRPRKKRIMASHENKNTNMVSRPRKTQVGVEEDVVEEEVVDEQVVEEQVVDEPQNAPIINEHSSQFEVGGSSDGRSKWFGLGQGQLESDLIEDSRNAIFEATHNSHIETTKAFADF